MKDKVCLICHTAIDMDKEFCEFKHYTNKDVIKTKAFYHVDCFRNRLNGAGVQNALAQKAMVMMDKMDKIGGVYG